MDRLFFIHGLMQISASFRGLEAEDCEPCSPRGDEGTVKVFARPDSSIIGLA